MLSIDEARRRAQAHLDANPIPDRDYQWALGDAVAMHDGWYFDYRPAHARDLPEEEWEEFLGAPGFVLMSGNDNAVRDLSVYEYLERGLDKWPRDNQPLQRTEAPVERHWFRKLFRRGPAR